MLLPPRQHLKKQEFVQTNQAGRVFPNVWIWRIRRRHWLSHSSPRSPSYQGAAHKAIAGGLSSEGLPARLLARSPPPRSGTYVDLGQASTNNISCSSGKCLATSRDPEPNSIQTTCSSTPLNACRRKFFSAFSGIPPQTVRTTVDVIRTPLMKFMLGREDDMRVGKGNTASRRH